MKKKHRLYFILVLAIIAIVYGLIQEASNKVKRTKSCWESIHAKLNTDQNKDSLLHDELLAFQELVEQSLVVRSEMLLIIEELKKNEEAPIKSKHLEIIKEGTTIAIDLREHLYEVAESYECAMKADKNDLEEYSVNEQQRLKATMLSLAAALTLYDNYLFGALLFEEDKRLRRLINDPDLGFGIEANKLLEVAWMANSIEKQNRIKKGIAFYEEKIAELKEEVKDDDFNYLTLLINSSPSYTYIRSLRKRDMAKNKFKLLGRITRDVIAELRNDGFDGVSQFFGNSVGLIETRKGKLYNQKEVAEQLRKELQPLDILLEKTPFRLTDKLIPGHFGHVAIWVGNEAELVELDLWDHEVIKPHQATITNGEGANIIEALRSGVQLSSLEHFLNVDDVAILRPMFTKEMVEDEKKEALMLAFRQLGKDYDFNFDVNTTEKIVCSELAYVSYPTIDWPTEKTIGRYTISPDNVAQLCWSGVPLKLVTFYHDGKLVEKERQVSLLKELMASK